MKSQPAETGPTPAEPEAVQPEKAAQTEQAQPEKVQPEQAQPGDSRTTDITAGPGGVMTDDVGVITGDLTVRSELDGGKLTVRVQYKEAEEWYVLTGGKAELKDPADLDAVHRIVVGVLNRPEG